MWLGSRNSFCIYSKITYQIAISSFKSTTKNLKSSKLTLEFHKEVFLGQFCSTYMSEQFHLMEEVITSCMQTIQPCSVTPKSSTFKIHLTRCSTKWTRWTLGLMRRTSVLTLKGQKWFSSRRLKCHEDITFKTQWSSYLTRSNQWNESLKSRFLRWLSINTQEIETNVSFHWNNLTFTIFSNITN